MINPWQELSWQQLVAYYQAQHIPQAVLLRGIVGLGKRHLAQCFSQLLLCESQQQNNSCGTCYSCNMLVANTHPDFYVIEPEESSSVITIEQIRGLQDVLHHTAHQGGYLCVVLDSVAAMNTYASNALLKVLEEPMPRTIIFLLDHTRTTVPATIVSRCQIISVKVPSFAHSLQWLEMQGVSQDPKFWMPILWATCGSPMTALQWQREGIWESYQNLMHDLLKLSTQTSADPLAIAQSWCKVSVTWLLDVLLQLVYMMMRKYYAWPIIPEFFPDLVSLPIPLYKLLEFADILSSVVQEVNMYNFNHQLLLEFIFIKWLEYATC